MNLNTQKHHMPEALLSALLCRDNIVNNCIINYCTVINVHCIFISNEAYAVSRSNLLICIRNLRRGNYVYLWRTPLYATKQVDMRCRSCTVGAHSAPKCLFLF
jgi:hypothetical protein